MHILAQVGTQSGGVTTYNDTGLTANTSYSYRVRATDAAGNLSGYSNTASARPRRIRRLRQAPTNLTAAAVSGTQINLSWTASTDNIGVTGYLIERCQGAGCSTFAQIATPVGTGTSYNDTGLTANQLQLSRAGDRCGRQPGRLLQHCEHRDPGGYAGADLPHEPHRGRHQRNADQSELVRFDRQRGRYRLSGRALPGSWLHNFYPDRYTDGTDHLQ